MAHYAFLDENNIVTEVIAGRDEHEVVDGISDWEAYYGELRGQVCKRTSYNTYSNTHLDNKTPFRYNYAGVGYTFDATIGLDGAFIPEKTFNSWILNTETYLWEAPVPMPDDDKIYVWDEENLNWEEIIIVTE
jgi:hypothetical protein